MNWQFSCIPGFGPDGRPLFSVIAKRTYAIAPGRVTRCETQLPLVGNDEYAEPQNPFCSDCIAESDLVACKPSTDVVIIGKACAPRGKKAFSLECEAAVGPLRKMVRVYGERAVEQKMVRGLYLTDPKPFSAIEFSYTRAFGGIAKSKNGTLFPYYPNPIGRGFSIRGGFEDVAELSVPNFEDPSSPVTADSLIVDKFEDWRTAPKPASFGWTRRDFFPRYTLCGVPPLFLEGAGRQAGVRTTAAATTMDPRFYQGASEGLHGVKLRGDESVTLRYFDPDAPVIQFALPGEKPVIIVDIGGGPVDLVPGVQTIIIDMNEKVLSMVWRGSCKMEDPGELAKCDIRVE